MYRVGLTGGIGSGKSVVSALFAELGVPVVDTDELARQLTAAGGDAMHDIRAAFGDEIMRDDGALDRAALRRRVFADSSERRKLEAILHPRIRRLVEQALSTLDVPYVLIVIPLLVETGGYRDLLDRVLVVDCPEAQQVARVMARSGLARDEVNSILAAQATRAERLAAADDVIVNAASIDSLRADVAALHQRYLAYAAAPSP